MLLDYLERAFDTLGFAHRPHLPDICYQNESAPLMFGGPNQRAVPNGQFTPAFPLDGFFAALRSSDSRPPSDTHPFPEFVREPRPPAKRPPPAEPESKSGPEPVSKLPKVALGALRSSLTTGVFVDCQFTLYSRRTSDGEGVDTPLAVYANSKVLKDTSDYFESLIAGGFSEGTFGGSIVGDKKPCPPSRIAAFEYEYESDSDLEDELEPRATLPSSSTSGLGAALDDYQQDVPNNEAYQGVATTSSTAVHHTISIPDVAFKTFRAFVYYAYTGDIQFAPLKSIEQPPSNDARAAVVSSMQADVSFRCSPKSMYRLADKYGLDELKERALKNIRSQLAHAPNAVLPELFSQFSARYPQVMTILAKLVCASVKAQPQGQGESSSESSGLTGLREWTDRVARGELPHAGLVLAELITMLATAKA
ncbi:hypothetical protein C8Q73DRAFT_486013 [Cubamyces lactineus]|nr:hypothetical protein C8Q73DRAFT_486013 [Cubamyces lactineus]